MPTYTQISVFETSTTGGAQILPAGRLSSGVLHSVNIYAPTNAATVVIYDNATAASGTVLARISAPLNWSNWVDYGNLPFKNGLWAVLTGAGSSVQVTVE